MAGSSTNISLILPVVTDATIVRDIYNLNWNTIDGRFSATYMAVQAKASVSITGGSITGITDLAVADGGTGSSTAANARTALGLAIGTNVQAYDAGLLSIAALTTAANKMIYTTALDTYAITALTAFARTILDDADASTVRTTLGLVIGTNVQAYDATLLSIAALGTAADKIAYTTGVDTWAEAALTAFGRSIIDDANEAAFKATVNLEIGTDVQAYDAYLTAIAALSKTDSSLIVGNGTTWVLEAGATLRTSIGCAATAQTFYIGTTQVAINRGTAALTLAGITLTTPDIGTPSAGTLTNCTFPTLNQNTTGTAANVSGTPALPNGTTATTQSASDNSTKLATTAYADAVGGYTNLTSFVAQTAFRVFYSDTAGDVTELALGADGTYLKSNGADQNPSFGTPAGAGDVTKVGTPANSQVGVWTGDGTIEGAASLTYDGSNLQLTGDIGSTGTRITKGWFANLETTGDLTVNGTALASIYATLGANTNITSILNTALYIGRDADNQIKFATDNNIVFRLAGADGASFISTGEFHMGAHSVGFTLQTMTGDGTDEIDWKLGNYMLFTTPNGDVTFTFVAPSNPCALTLQIKQDANGGHDMTFPAEVKWLMTEPTWSDGGASKTIIMSMRYDGTDYWSQATSWEA